jgi:hypothetical protein
VAHLADFIRDVEAIFDELDLTAAIYGHAGSGNLHLRPLFDRHAPNLPALLEEVADRVYEAVLRYGGTITAEHGMGRLRTPYLAREWGEDMMRHMRRVKEIFDPDGVLNPDVMFSDRALTDDLKPLESRQTSDSSVGEGGKDRTPRSLLGARELKVGTTRSCRGGITKVYDSGSAGDVGDRHLQPILTDPYHGIDSLYDPSVTLRSRRVRCKAGRREK